MLIVSAREFSQLNANRLFNNGNMCPIAFRSARGNSRVDCFGFGGCLSLPLPRSGEGVWSLWFDAHAGGLADVSLTQVPQPPRSPPPGCAFRSVDLSGLGHLPRISSSQSVAPGHIAKTLALALHPVPPSQLSLPLYGTLACVHGKRVIPGDIVIA